MLGEKDDINLEAVERKNVILGFYGIFYIIILGLVAGLGWFYLNNLEAFTREEVTPLARLKDTVRKSEDTPMLKGTISPPVDIFKESVSSPEKVAKGKTSFETNCSSCHGAEGKGDGIAGKSMNPPPRNFHDLNGWTNGPSFSKIFKTLQEGITARGMSSYSSLPVEDRAAIIHYIRTFRNDYPAIEQSELKELDKTYNLSSGTKQPSQIPVKTATEKMLSEDSVFYVKAEYIISKIKSDTTNKAAEKFNSISYDLNRSVYSLANSGKWREGEGEFINFISTDPKSKGFRASVKELTSEDWGILYIYIKSLF